METSAYYNVVKNSPVLSEEVKEVLTKREQGLSSEAREKLTQVILAYEQQILAATEQFLQSEHKTGSPAS